MSRMIDEEEARQRMEVTGTEIVVCDLCGLPVELSKMRLVDPQLLMPEADYGGEQVWICPACWRALEAGEFDFDIERAEDIGVPSRP
jgi:hypothetical protein